MKVIDQLQHANTFELLPARPNKCFNLFFSTVCDITIRPSISISIILYGTNPL